MTGGASAAGDAGAAGADGALPTRVGTLEIFFALVFAFTLTQLTSVLATKLSWLAVGQVILVFGLLWWMYGAYAWLTNSRPPVRTAERLLLLVGMAGCLVVGLAIPEGFASYGLVLGLGYLVVVIVHTVLYYRVNKHILRVAPFNLGSALLVTAAGLLHGSSGTASGPAYGLWIAALAVQLGSPLIVRPSGFFELRPEHFSERHSALLIVAIGEAVAAVGIGAAGPISHAASVNGDASAYAAGPEHPGALATRSELAYSIGLAGDAAGARDQFAALVPVAERVLGPEHPDTLAARASLAYWTGQAGDAAAARTQFAALLPVAERVLGPEHPDTLINRHNLANFAGYAGDAAAARDQYAILLRVRERVFGADSPDTLVARFNLAYWTGRAGDAVAARDQFAALLPVRARIYGAEHPDTLAAREELAYWTGCAGAAATARDQFAALLPSYERVLGPEHADTLAVWYQLAHWTALAGGEAAAHD